MIIDLLDGVSATELVILVAFVLGTILTILKGVAWSIESYGKFISGPRERKRAETDERAHKPIYNSLDFLKRLLVRNNVLTVANSKTMITLIMELDGKGKVSEKSLAEMEELRKLIYAPFTEEEEEGH